ncbi:hypothetical protein B0H13DRAFT_1997314 [Mycena leptocephala]|nr:hypothetical protein B0H13DRAFT_1997314 [Mycena leptocephala]
MVPNFVGGALPRMDQGDREYYCTTILTLFKPWRSGKDLKNDLDNWDETFLDHRFSPKALDTDSDWGMGDTRKSVSGFLIIMVLPGHGPNPTKLANVSDGARETVSSVSVFLA